jgi:hypothetical protein
MVSKRLMRKSLIELNTVDNTLIKSVLKRCFFRKNAATFFFNRNDAPQ